MISYRVTRPGGNETATRASRVDSVALPTPRQVVTGGACLLAGLVLLSGVRPATAAPDIPSGLPPSPLNVPSTGAGPATEFTQQMLRFEEFAVRPMPDNYDTPKSLPVPGDCTSSPDPLAMDTLFTQSLYPAPLEEANIGLPNPWAGMINPCLSLSITGAVEGRPPGVNFAHQRWSEFPPQVYFESAMAGARQSHGVRDVEQRHHYSLGEFGPVVPGQEDETGLYHNVVGVPGFEGTTNGIDIRLHPNLPIQDPNSLWTFGGGTLPPKLLMARVGVPMLFRHYNALPIDPLAHNGFGEHTITTHEHNGHNPGESDGFAGAYFFPGQFYDYRWPMQIAGYDSINTDAADPHASTPCAPGEVLMISDPLTGAPVEKTCSGSDHTVNIAGDWHEIMSTHWFHDHMIDRTSENVYKGNAAMMNYYSGIDRGQEGFKCNYDNPNNINLCFPSGTALNWGNRDYDVNLVIADKAWDATGQLDMSPLNEDGFLGDRMTVNWLYKPYLDVRARRYRLRLLNGSVARWYKIAIVREYDDATTGDLPGPAGSNTSYSRIPFHMIANDGNIMEHSVPFPNPQSDDLPIQAIAERHDVIIDFSQFPAGTKLYMVNTLEFANDGRGPSGPVPLANILNGTYNPVADPLVTAGGGCDPTDPTPKCWSLDPAVGKFLELRVHAYSGTDLSMDPADYEPGKKMMIPLVKFTDEELANATHRSFSFGRGGGVATDLRPTPWTISTDGGANLNADVGVVSAAPETMGGGVEIWHIINGGGGWGHPVHVHFEEGQYLLRKDLDELGNVTAAHLPPLWEIGARKDMYRVSDLGINLGIPDSSMAIDVAIRFREFAGTFVEHCHNTTHEDKSMLLRWDNESPGQTVRIPTPIPDWAGVSYAPPTTLATFKTGDTRYTPDPVTGVAEIPFQPPLQLPADVNWDGIVTSSDVAILRSQFGLAGLWASDLDESGVVTSSDVATFRTQFGQSTGYPLPPNNPLP
jgi:FtsP/CotA-like multicopper oxidase with cupredoxin domain